MSTPFPLEEQSVAERLNSGPMSDPWQGPVKPGFFTGMGYDEDNAYLGPSTPILTGAAAALNKAVAGAAGAASSFYSAEGEIAKDLASAVGLQSRKNPLQMIAEEFADTQAWAQKNVETLTPSPQTTGTAFQIVHGVSEGATLAVTGGAGGGVPGAALLTGATEGASSYEQNIKAGVGPNVAAAEASVSAVTSGAGVLIPGGFGSTLVRKMLTGIGSQVGLGLASRYADHQILEVNGYHEMAEQQKVWDSTQALTDAILGAAFGGLAHLHGAEARALEAAANRPGMVDAALVTNLAAQDRNLAVGVPVDPTAAHAHGDALEVSTEQLLEGKQNDVSQTGVNEAKFATRPIDETRQAEAQAIAREYVPERLPEVHASISEALAQQRDQLVSDSAAFLRGNDARTAARELEQHEKARSEAQSAYEAIPEPKQAAELKAEILARMEAEDRASYGEVADSARYAKLRDKAATKEAREMAAQAQSDYLQQKANAQEHVDDIDERVARQRNEVTRLTRAEESFKALRAHDKAVREAGNDPAKLVEIIADEQDRRALRDQLPPMEPTEENLARHMAENPNAAIGGYFNHETGQVHLDDIKEAAPFRLSERDLGEGHGEQSRPDEDTAVAGAGSVARRGDVTVANAAGNRAASADATAGAESRATSAVGAGSRLTDTVRSALKERPDLQVPGDDGKPTSAAAMLRQAQEEAAMELSDFQKSVMAAITCFGRLGA
jgi:hypothetical protein